MANLLTLVDGNKGEDDVLVLLNCQDEPLTFAEALFILGEIFKSEDSYYPRKRGYAGSRYMLDAILDIYHGFSLGEVCKKYHLEQKINIIDRRRRNKIQSLGETSKILTGKSKLADILV